MLTEATKQILSFKKQAEQRKAQLQQYLQNLENKKSRDTQQLHRDEIRIQQSRNNPDMDTTEYMRDAYEDKKEIMDDDHEIAELKRKLADVDKKISEINHWTAQSEYDDPKKQQEAIDTARRTLQAI